jgi:hypothetical protein
MPTLSIAMNESLFQATKAYANQHATSISQIVRNHLAQLTSIKPTTEIETLERFSGGEIGRLEAMKTLHIDYSTLLERLGQQGLSLPTLPADELEQMVNNFVHIINEARKP